MQVAWVMLLADVDRSYLLVSVISDLLLVALERPCLHAQPGLELSIAAEHSPMPAKQCKG